MKIKPPTFTQAELKDWLIYDTQSGDFFRRRKYRKQSAGDKAGFLHATGYIVIGLFGEKWKAHHLAWYYVTGLWPKETIDHEDRVRNNNAFSNLRPASKREQSFNRSAQRRKKSSQYVGVFAKGRKWMAAVRTNGVLNYLGTFETEEMARDAYESAKSKVHVFKARAS